MEYPLLLIILLVHYFADFFVQTQAQAEGKSNDIEYLTIHVLTYTACFLPICVGVQIYSHDTVETPWALLAALLIFIGHWITDYFTSRVSSQFFKVGKHRQGFQVVGFDQTVHFIHLWAVFNWLYYI